MKNKLNRKSNLDIIAALVLLFFGVLLLFKSELTIVTITYVIGGMLIGVGFLAIIRFTRHFRENYGTELDIIYGIVTIIMGLLVIKNPHVIGSIIPIIIGISIIIKSSIKLQHSLELRGIGTKDWIVSLVISIISLVCGVILLFNPFKGAIILTQIIGALIIVYSVLDIVSTIILSKGDNIKAEAVVIEDDEITVEEEKKEITTEEPKKEIEHIEKKPKNKKTKKKVNKDDAK